MHRENETVFSGNVSWNLDENATKTISIPAQEYGAGDEKRLYLISIKNGSAVVSLQADIYNKESFDVITDSRLATVDTIDAGKAESKIVEGFLYGSGGGSIILTKSASAAAAFSA
jgi:hypothetical protein